MSYYILWKILSILFIILRASARESGNIDYPVNSGDVNVDSQANRGDVTGWLMAEGAHYNSEGPAQAQLHDGHESSDWFVSDSELCSRPDTYDIQSSSSGHRLDKKGIACKNVSPPNVQQRGKKPVQEDQDIIPDAMPHWPTLQLQPDRQICDHESYSIPACARIEGAIFVSLFLYDIPLCRPCTLFPRFQRVIALHTCNWKVAQLLWKPEILGSIMF